MARPESSIDRGAGGLQLLSSGGPLHFGDGVQAAPESNLYPDSRVPCGASDVIPVLVLVPKLRFDVRHCRTDPATARHCQPGTGVGSGGLPGGEADDDVREELLAVSYDDLASKLFRREQSRHRWCEAMRRVLLVEDHHLGVTYTVPVFRTLRPWVKAEILNLTNNQKVIAFNTTVTPDPNSALDANGLATGYVRGPQFGQATANTHYPLWRPGFTGGRTYLLAAGIRF